MWITHVFNLLSFLEWFFKVQLHFNSDCTQSCRKIGATVQRAGKRRKWKEELVGVVFGRTTHCLSWVWLCKMYNSWSWWDYLERSEVIWLKPARSKTRWKSHDRAWHAAIYLSSYYRLLIVFPGPCFVKCRTDAHDGIIPQNQDWLGWGSFAVRHGGIVTTVHDIPAIPSRRQRNSLKLPLWSNVFLTGPSQMQTIRNW